MGYGTRTIYIRPFGFSVSKDERDDSGQYTETVTLDDVLGVFEAVEGPVVTSGDVAETLDCSRETARRKLRTLEEHGRVASRKTAGRVVWWVVTDRELPRGVDPDDPFWEFEPGASGESDVSERVDEVLYDSKSI
jgi:HTH domain.